MSRAVLVCPFERDLLDRIQDRVLVIRTTDCEQVVPISNHVALGTCRLQAIALEYDGALASLNIDARWKDIPLRITCRSLGPYEDLSARMPLLQTMNISIFLPADRRDNFSGLRILSSLGIRCGLTFPTRDPNWGLVNDLMHYQVYSRTTHADIEPFASVIVGYDSQKDSDFSDAFHNNPRSYLHLDAEGRIAPTREDLEAGVSTGISIEDVATLGSNDLYLARCLAWQQHFIDFGTCSTCPAWRVCRGTFWSEASPEGGCSAFFLDILEACEFHAARAGRTEVSPCQS